MKKSRCLSQWRKGVPVLGISLHFTDPTIYELTSILGFDVIWIDLEHHSHSIETVGGLMRAARVGESDILARPGKGEFMRTARLLEAGAQGIMYPRCQSVQEAKEVVFNMKFAPKGGRGLDAAGPDSRYGTMGLEAYLENAQNETFLMVQIEDGKGLAAASDIAAVEGVDLLFFGPGDYSLEQGFVGQFNDSRYWEAIKTVASSAVEAGKMWGSPAFSAEHGKKLLEMGAMFITYSSDITLLRKRLIGVQDEFRELGFTFG